MKCWMCGTQLTTGDGLGDLCSRCQRKKDNYPHDFVYIPEMNRLNEKVTLNESVCDKWISIEDSIEPMDGMSVWLVVREWDGVHFHVDYGITFRDYDGLLVHREEGAEGNTDEFAEYWPPKDITHWMYALVPTPPQNKENNK